MYLAIVRKPRNLKKAILLKALDYAEEYLKMPFDIDLTIEFEKLEGVEVGFAMDADDNEYEITIDSKQTPRQMIHTLLHELVHVNQYVTGRLVSGEGRKPNRWLGKPNYDDYANQPWEIEAYDLDKKMMRNFIRKCKKEGIEL
jgi:hypothetical protein